MIAWLVFFLVPAFFVLVAVFFVVMFNRLRARVLAIQALAQRIGFTFSSSDVEHIVALPLPAFSRGEARRVELVISGTHNGVPLRIVYYSYSCAGSDSSRYEFTCALATIDGQLYAFTARDPSAPSLLTFRIQPDSLGVIVLVDSIPMPANYGIHDTFVRDGPLFVEN